MAGRSMCEHGSQRITYCMRPIICPLKRRHAVNASKYCATALVAVRVKFLLGKDIATALQTELLTGVIDDLSRIDTNLALK